MSYTIKLANNNNSMNFPENKTPLRNETWVSDANWSPVFDFIDKKDVADHQLSKKEVSLFVRDIKNAAGEDGILQEQELKNLAGSYKVNMKTFKNAVNTLSGMLVANNISSKFAGWFGDPADLEGAEKAIMEQVNSNNAAVVVAHKPELLNKITANYPDDKATQMLNKIFEDLKVTAKENGVRIDTLVEKYEEAKSKNDTNAMKSCINGVIQYFNNKYVVHNVIQAHNPTHTTYRGRFAPEIKEKPMKITETNKIKIQQFAIENNAEITDDLVGDGIVGNTKSVSSNPQGNIIHDAIIELLENPEFKEKLETCYKKEGNKMGFYWSKANAGFCSGENGLVECNEIEKGVVGDGDMTLVVAAVIKRLQSESYPYLNKEDVKNFILDRM